MIIVTGATGQLGRAVVERLLTRVAPGELGVSVRDPGKAQDLADRGVRVRAGTFDDPSGLAHAFAGASQVLIVSGPVDAAVHHSVIGAAAAAGAQRIVYTGHMGARPDSPFRPMPGHATTEDNLRASGVAFTALRNGFYATSAIRLMGRALSTGELAVPADGPVSWTAHADLADAAVLALTGRLDGVTPPLTGPRALDFAGIAAVASELTGREITRVTVPDDEWAADLVAHGASEDGAAMLVGMFVASRRGDFAAVDPTLGTLLGRAPTPFRDVLAATLTR